MDRVYIVTHFRKGSEEVIAVYRSLEDAKDSITKREDYLKWCMDTEANDDVYWYYVEGKSDFYYILNRQLK